MNVHLPEVFFKDTKNLKSCNEEIYKCRTLPEYGSAHNDCLPAICNCRNEMIKYVYTMGWIAALPFSATPSKISRISGIHFLKEQRACLDSEQSQYPDK